MTVRGTWEGGYRTRLGDSNGHSVTVDLPPYEGGDDRGPFALELAAMSLAGCITTVFALVARKRRLEFDRMEVHLDWERPAGSPTITTVDGVLRLSCAAPEEEVETALRITVRTCPVGVLFERAGIPVRVRLELLPPRPHDAVPAA